MYLICPVNIKNIRNELMIQEKIHYSKRFVQIFMVSTLNFPPIFSSKEYKYKS